MQTVTVAATDATAQEVDLTVRLARRRTPAPFVVTRSGDTTSALTVYYSVSGTLTQRRGRAAWRGLRGAARRRSSFPPGQARPRVTILPRFDTIGEGPESVVLHARRGVDELHPRFAPAPRTVTITDGAGDVPYVDVVNTSERQPSHRPMATSASRCAAARAPARSAVNYTLGGTATSGDGLHRSLGRATRRRDGITLTNGATVTTDIVRRPGRGRRPGGSRERDAHHHAQRRLSDLRADLHRNHVVARRRPADRLCGHAGRHRAAVSTFTEGASTTPVKFYVSRTGSTTGALTVNYTAGGTATSRQRLHRAPRLGRDPGRRARRGCARRGHQRHPLRRHGDDRLQLRARSLFRSAGTVMYLADNDTATRTLGFQAPGSSGLESVTSVNIPVTLSSASASAVTVEYAVSASTGSGTATTVASQTIPKWFRLVRTGNTFASSYSSDGSAWTAIGSSQTLALGPTALAGLAVSAKSDGS